MSSEEMRDEVTSVEATDEEDIAGRGLDRDLARGDGGRGDQRRGN